MKNTNRTKGTTVKRLLGLDGNATYGAVIGAVCALPAVPVLIGLSVQGKNPIVTGLIGATITTVTSIVVDQSIKKHYSNTEYAIIFISGFAGYSTIAHNLRKTLPVENNK